MTKEELMARAAELKLKETNEMVNTLVVDVHCKAGKDYVTNVAKNCIPQFKYQYGAEEVKLLIDYINPFTPPAKFKSALTAVRLGKSFKHILLITDEYHSVTDWVKTYQGKGANVFVHLVGTTVVYTGTEYLDDIDGEMILDFVLRSRYSKDRALLEDFAEIFGTALGWNFSGPIRERQLTPEAYDSFLPYDTLPYAGRDAYYFKDDLHEASEPSGKITVTPTLRTRLNATQGVPLSELEQFRDFLLEAHKLGIEQFLELDWAICEVCGHPVRTVSEVESTESALEQGCCPYCDTLIPGFDARVYSPYVESIEDEDFTDDITEESFEDIAE